MRTKLISVRGVAVAAFTTSVAVSSQAIQNDVTSLEAVANNEVAHAEHCDNAVAGGDFEEIFNCGDEFFEVDFNAAEGGGANVGDGNRYTRTPRADLNGAGEWADHFPKRPTGPNSASCGECHSFPVGTAAGRAGFNVVRDPFHTGDLGQMIFRNTPHLMGSGALQLLAEEINIELEGLVQEAVDEACDVGGSASRDLVSKDVNYGSVQVTGRCAPFVNLMTDGVDDDLVVKPFQWKGSDHSMRAFVRVAFNNEIGIQPVETTGGGVDGDGDGVTDEASIADLTATSVYAAGQPRPVTEIELNDLRREMVRRQGERKGNAAADMIGLPALTVAEIATINAGETAFMAIGCGDCHMPQMLLDNPVFSEPSTNPNYRDNGMFPAGQPAEITPVMFDLTTDLLDNHIFVGKKFIRNMANFLTNEDGKTIVSLYGDLKRHDMGPGLAEQIDEVSTGASVWMTKELWGVGSTPPYLHDGRATTLTEAILLHGGDAQVVRDNFVALTPGEQAAVARFLRNLVILKIEKE